MIANLRFADPGFQSLILALQTTIAGLMGAAFWILFRPPDPLLIVSVPWLLALILNKLRSSENCLRVFILSSASVAVGCFLFAALYNTRVLILLFLFGYTFLNFASSEYRPAGSLVVLVGGMSTAYPGGWHLGVNYAILIGISFIIVLITFFSFSRIYLLSIRSILGLLLEQVMEAFRGRLVLEGKYAENLDFERKIDGAYAAVALKANLLIRKTTYILPAEKRLVEKACAVLFHLRMLMADRAMMRGFSGERERLLASAPNTVRVIKSIHERWEGALSALHSRTGPDPREDEPAYKVWAEEIKASQSLEDPATSSVSRIIYGLECTLDDLTHLETAIYEMNHSRTIPRSEKDRPRPFRAVWRRLHSCRLKMAAHPVTPVKAVSCRKSDPSPSPPSPEIQRGIYQDAFKAAVATTFALFVWKATHLPHGYWLLLVTSALFAGGNQGQVLQRLGHRLIGTAIGIFLAYFFVRDFLGHDFTWAYILPVIFFFMFYLFFLTGTYAVLVVLVTLFVGVLLSTIGGSEGQVDFFLAGALFNRFICTLLAGMIVALAVTTIFPNANRSADIMERTLSSLLDDLSHFMKVLVNRYILGQSLTEDEWVILNTVREKYASTEQLHTWMQYEINLDEHYNSLYKASSLEMDRLFSVMGGLIGFSCHARKTSFSEEEKRAIQMAGARISETLKHLESTVLGGSATGLWKEAAPQIRTLLNGDLRKHFFVQELERFAEVLDGLMRRFREEALPRTDPEGSVAKNGKGI